MRSSPSNTRRAAWPAATLAGLATIVVAAQNVRSTADGVYTREQARRGEAVYANACAHCHQSDLSGGTDDDSGPALAGPRFQLRWRDKPLEALFDLVSRDMPYDKPGTLAPQAYADVLAFVLERNGAPAGASELPPDADGLKAVVFREAMK
jgi:mono/diheme cytochrome c family protein